jgi:hypothetical protein
MAGGDSWRALRSACQANWFSKSGRCREVQGGSVRDALKLLIGLMPTPLLAALVPLEMQQPIARRSSDES